MMQYNYECCAVTADRKGGEGRKGLVGFERRQLHRALWRRSHWRQKGAGSFVFVYSLYRLHMICTAHSYLDEQVGPVLPEELDEVLVLEQGALLDDLKVGLRPLQEVHLLQ